MTAKELYDRALVLVKAAQAIWVALILTFGVFAVMVLPWWAVILVPIVSSAIYHLMIMASGAYIASIAEIEQIKECREMLIEEERRMENPQTETPDSGLSLGDIVTTGEHIGNFGDRKIYDWIDVQCASGLHRFTYDRSAEIEKGEYVNVSHIKDDEACYFGVIYKKVTTKS